eukprot:PhF_6_TR23743/c0_g1_i2/m.33162/K10280/FBXL14; F-box and leucine-rich repeat protein 14
MRHLTNLTGLKTLHLNWCDHITEVGFASLSTALTSLTELHVDGCRVTNQGLKHFEAFKSLTTLDLASNDKITDSGLQHLDQLSCITDLNLSNIPMTDIGLQCVLKPTLTSLCLFWCQVIRGQSLEHISKLSALKTLDLSGCDNAITDTGLQHIATNLTSLSNLHMIGCLGLTDIGLSHIAKMTSLQELHLARNETITCAGVIHVVSMLPALKNLDISNCIGVMDDALQHLGKSLTCLNVGWTDITDEGLKHLLSLPSLSSLDVAGCKLISDEGVIQYVANLPSLHTLNIHACKELTE